ncbi:MAG: tetratricopeptide repeat protein [Planctomycetota bacterium]
MLRLVLLFALLPFASGCALLPGSSRRPLALEDVDAALATAGEELAANRPLDALERLERVHRTRTISPENRQAADVLTRAALDQAIASERVDARDLTDVYGLELPRNARARAGIAAAERLYESDRPVSAYKQVRKVELALPAHPERARAGDLLARVGFDLIERDGRYFLILSYRARGLEALEFFVVHYPFHPACEEAYLRLAGAYEETGDYDDAIEHLEDLLVYHPESSVREEVEARLPALRLAMLAGRDYDRGELELAHAELEGWLARNAGHPLEDDVRATRVIALRRLARSDLKLARYYATIGVTFGVRFHATRALTEAEQADAAKEIAAAKELLERFPEGRENTDGEMVPLDKDALELEDPLGPRLGPGQLP